MHSNDEMDFATLFKKEDICFLIGSATSTKVLFNRDGSWGDCTICKSAAEMADKFGLPKIDLPDGEVLAINFDHTNRIVPIIIKYDDGFYYEVEGQRISNGKGALLYVVGSEQTREDTLVTLNNGMALAISVEPMAVEYAQFVHNSSRSDFAPRLPRPGVIL